jgi:hypothetical protein
MALIMPSEAIARRWNGALQARLRRAPLEEFLRVRDLKVAPAGAARDTDNLVRATVYMVDAGVRFYSNAHEDALDERQQALLARGACMVSHSLAGLIGEQAAWRIAALVSAAQLLNPWIGINAAAYAAAAAAQRFSEELLDPTRAPRTLISEKAAIAVERNDDVQVDEVARLISQNLASVNDHPMVAQPHAGSFVTRG